MRHILPSLLQTLEAGQLAVIVTIIKRSGSAPRNSGARMLVTAAGQSAGTIGGGEVEGHCLQEAVAMLQKNEGSRIIDFNLDNETAAESGMLCGGAVQVLLHRVLPAHLPLYLLLEEAYKQRERPINLTRIPKTGEEPGLSTITQEHVAGEKLSPTILSVIRRKTKARTPFILELENTRFFAEPLVDPGCLYLIGAGHVSLATAKLAAFTDFSVKVMDDRAEFANVNRFPDAKEVTVLQDFSNCLPKLGQDDYVVIVTRGHAHDREVLEQALQTGAGYIGMIGSQKKRDIIYAALQEKGFSKTQLDAVHCPIGLGIGADTPEEIALSIIGELVQHRAGLFAA